jgi:hypothetical protein
LSIIPLRALGKAGVLTDVDPFNLPVEALSFGKNIRTSNGTISRGAVFRTVGAMATDPKHMLSFQDTSGNYRLLYVGQNGNIRSWTSGVEADVSVAGWVSANSDAPVTSCFNNNMIYVNRPDRVPWYRSKDLTTAFTNIPTGGANWDTTHRTQVLRSFAGVLMALNVTKGATVYPNMVKWSDFTSYGAGPANWDVASTTSSAGENILADMNSPIVDGVVLRNRMIIYGAEDTWFAEYIGGNDMFRWDRAFGFGVMGANCVVEHNNTHYVFGNNDLYVHDGIQERSIATGRVRNFIYNSLRKSMADTFFVAHNPALSEVMFCYVSDDPYCAFPASSSVKGCNRGAIYNYADDTWNFADLPYLTHFAQAKADIGVSFDASGGSYDSAGGSFAALGGDAKLTLMTCGLASGSLPRSLRSYEAYSTGSTTYPLDAFANAGAYMERLGLDLDELKVPLRGYKLLSSVYPQGRMDVDVLPLKMTFGIADHPTEATSWGTEQTFDRTYYKLDFNQAGRYLSYKIVQSDFKNFSLSGFDFDAVILGQF